MGGIKKTHEAKTGSLHKTTGKRHLWLKGGKPGHDNKKGESLGLFSAKVNLKEKTERKKTPLGGGKRPRETKALAF